MLRTAIDQAQDIDVVEHCYETVTDANRHRVDQPDYEVDVIRKGDHGWFLSRKIVFSRTDLLPHRQFIYDQNGNLATDVHYENYKDYSGLRFPTQIAIYRPVEEYDMSLTIDMLQLYQR